MKEGFGVERGRVFETSDLNELRLALAGHVHKRGADSLMLSHKPDPQQRMGSAQVSASTLLLPITAFLAVPHPPCTQQTNSPNPLRGWNLLCVDIKSLSQIAADKIAEP